MSGALAFQPLLNASEGQTPTSVQSVQQSKDLSKVQGFPGGAGGKESSCQCQEMQET